MTTYVLFYIGMSYTVGKLLISTLRVWNEGVRPYWKCALIGEFTVFLLYTIKNKRICLYSKTGDLCALIFDMQNLLRLLRVRPSLIWENFRYSFSSESSFCKTFSRVASRFFSSANLPHLFPRRGAVWIFTPGECPWMFFPPSMPPRLLMVVTLWEEHFWIGNLK